MVEQYETGDENQSGFGYASTPVTLVGSSLASYEWWVIVLVGTAAEDSSQQQIAATIEAAAAKQRFIASLRFLAFTAPAPQQQPRMMHFSSA